MSGCSIGIGWRVDVATDDLAYMMALAMVSGSAPAL